MLGKIFCSLGVGLVLRWNSDACQVCVEIVRVEETEFSVRLVHGDDTPHHHLSEIGERESEVFGRLLGIEQFSF